MEKIKKYLPSKKFSYIAITILALFLIIFFIYKVFFGIGHSVNFKKQNNKLSTLSTTDDLLQQDSDGDGILDWEEALWGTDPLKKVTFNNIPDTQYIKQKKDDLKLNSDENNPENTTDLTETDKFAREFFATYLALQQSGQIDQTTMNNLSSSLGQKIIDPTLENKYSQSDFEIKETTKETEIEYYTKVQNLFATYKNTQIGEEVNIIADITNNENATDAEQYEAENELLKTANAYQDFAKKLTKITVPSDLISYHTNITNNSYNLGVSVKNMSKTINDPVVGLSGLAQYQQYSEDFIKSVNDLKTYLITNGIIK
ncbi:thrombospondin type 3 repeat-containing protein [Candidatus Nomurabacteria bacterium]|nr:thrombospondin type 3 repeat-containing protein [Candidatus Nomurabacteria bacterium]